MYRLVLISNGVYKKTLLKSNSKKSLFVSYRMFKDNNKSILFPKRFINSNGIHSVVYKICVVQDVLDDSTVVNLSGNFLETPFGIKLVLVSSVYNIEETFWMYGRDSKTERVNIIDILNTLVVPLLNPINNKNVIVVHNKLIIYNEDIFDMIICKSILDAQRLHHMLFKSVSEVNIKYILFLGTASTVMISEMYDIILKNTDWTIEKIRRTSTRY